jgi:chitin-binding protein
MLSLNRRRRAVLRLLPATLVAMVVVTGAAAGASAHGNVIDPASRNYGCWKRWGSDFQNPAMATQDPMCWQAWQHDPNAMWNWNGLYQEGVNGQYTTVIKDGTLCSGGQTGDGRYNSLDTPGNWVAANISSSSNFNVTVHDQARHGAKYYRLYVSKQGFDPLTQRLGWGDLTLLKDTGYLAPGAGQASSDPVLNGVSNTFNLSAPGLTGRHIVFVLWLAGHSDQSYYWCSDVNFGGSGGGTTSTTTTRPTTTTTRPNSTTTTTRPNSTTTTTTRPVTTTSGGGSGGGKTCSAAYKLTGSWGGGFQGEVTVTAGSAAISGWKVTWTWANGQTINQSWSATVTQSGSAVTATNAGYNASLAAGAATTFGFLGGSSGTNTNPTLTCTAS